MDACVDFNIGPKDPQYFILCGEVFILSKKSILE